MPETSTVHARPASRGRLVAIAALAAALASLGAECTVPFNVDVEVRDGGGALVPAKISVYDATTDEPVVIKTTSSGIYLDLFQHTAYLGAGAAQLKLDPGTYDIYASRGIEYSVDVQTVVVDQNRSASFTVSRVVNTAGYLSADFHIHGAASFDNFAGGIDRDSRVVSFAVEGVEIMGSSDHDCIVDYAPSISSLGLGSLIKSVVGVEATPRTVIDPPDVNGNCLHVSAGSMQSERGHWNAFPLQPGTSFDSNILEGVNAATFYDRLRALSTPTPLIQLNHPYLAYQEGGAVPVGNIGWFSTDFNNFQPTVPIPPTNTGGVNSFLRKVSIEPGSSTESIDFDAMEIIPGGLFKYYQPTRAAWFSLLNQGFFKVGTANSDTHKYNHKTAGFPRNFLATNATPGSVTSAQITSAVAGGRVIGTTGPFPTISINGAPMGSLVTDTDGTVAVNVVVQAAPWIPVEQVRVVANGVVVQTINLPAQNPEPVVRYGGVVNVAVTRDTWILVEAGAAFPSNPTAEPPTPPVYGHVTTGFAPASFTNPIFVDFNGNGTFNPPGV